MTTAVRTLSRATLEDLRAEIDAIDDSLHDLLMRRASLAADIARLKNGGAAAPAGKRNQGPFFRPGREAAVVRRILGRHAGPFPAAALVRIWREVMGAILNLQGQVTVAAPGTALGEMARDHFGTGATVRPQASPAAAIRALVGGRATVAVVPWPKASDRRWRAERPWWLALARDGAPRVVAALPALAAKTSPTALIVAPMPPESSGDDRTLIAVSCRRTCSSPTLARALAASGLKGRVVARASAGRAALIEVEGFVSDQSVNLEALTLVAGNVRPVVIGAYAVPSAPGRGASSGVA